MLRDDKMLRSNESHSLIAADKVEGTYVYDASGESIGTVHDLMIDKVSGKVAYVVLSSGGILGIGDKRIPLPWGALTYDTDKGGYVTSISRDTLTTAPAYADQDTIDWSDRAWGERVHGHYGTTPYWNP